MPSRRQLMLAGVGLLVPTATACGAQPGPEDSLERS